MGNVRNGGPTRKLAEVTVRYFVGTFPVYERSYDISGATADDVAFTGLRMAIGGIKPGLRYVTVAINRTPTVTTVYGRTAKGERLRKLLGTLTRVWSVSSGRHPIPRRYVSQRGWVLVGPTVIHGDDGVVLGGSIVYDGMRTYQTDLEELPRGVPSADLLVLLLRGIADQFPGRPLLVYSDNYNLAGVLADEPTSTVSVDAAQTLRAIQRSHGRIAGRDSSPIVLLRGPDRWSGRYPSGCADGENLDTTPPAG